MSHTIILGTDSNGRIIYFTRGGALHDVLEWAIDTGDIVRLMTGETTVSEVAKKKCQRKHCKK